MSSSPKYQDMAGKPMFQAKPSTGVSVTKACVTVRGPRLWNVIPQNQHDIGDPVTIKEKLTEFVKSCPDEPPVTGYSYRNGNSLLDWNGDKTASTVVFYSSCWLFASRLLFPLQLLSRSLPHISTVPTIRKLRLSNKLLSKYPVR